MNLPVTVTFFSNFNSEISVTQVASGSEFLKKNEFLRERFTFKGWSLTRVGKVDYRDQQLFVFSTNQALYAVWEVTLPYAMSHKVVFPMNGGTPVVFISGGVPTSELDKNSPLAKQRYDAVCQVIQELDIDAQVIRGVFDGPPNEIEVIFYWPKDFDDGSDSGSIDDLNLPNARSFTITFLTDRSTQIPNSVKEKLKKFLNDAKKDVPTNQDQLDGTTLTKFNDFLKEVEKVAPPGIEPQIYVSGGSTKGSGSENSDTAKLYYDAVCEALFKRGIVGQIIESVFFGQENVIEITFYWGLPS